MKRTKKAKPAKSSQLRLTEENQVLVNTCGKINLLLNQFKTGKLNNRQLNEKISKSHDELKHYQYELFVKSLNK